MKKALLFLAVLGLLQSCGLPAPKEQTIEGLDVTISVPTDKKIRTNAATQYSMASASFYIDKSRFEIREIEEKSMPTDLTMLEEAIKATSDFKALTDKKSLPNGAFGVLYDNQKGKAFLFYYKKGSRCYRIIPVFNTEGKYYEEALAAIGTLK